jgi:hypothetical protein
MAACVKVWQVSQAGVWGDGHKSEVQRRWMESDELAVGAEALRP